MSLINCPECGKENVSSSAISCPSCGFPIKEYFEKEYKEKEAIEKQRHQEEARLSMEAKIKKYHEEHSDKKNNTGNKSISINNTQPIKDSKIKKYYEEKALRHSVNTSDNMNTKISTISLKKGDISINENILLSWNNIDYIKSIGVDYNITMHIGTKDGKEYVYHTTLDDNILFKIHDKCHHFDVASLVNFNYSLAKHHAKRKMYTFIGISCIIHACISIEMIRLGCGYSLLALFILPIFFTIPYGIILTLSALCLTALNVQQIYAIDRRSKSERLADEIQTEKMIAEMGAKSSVPWERRYITSPCPYCGHYKVRYSKWEDKMFSFAFWGVFSAKLGKHYKCEHCNRMW